MMSAIVSLYVRKIMEHQINMETGDVWSIEDVPVLWREKVREMIENE